MNLGKDKIFEFENFKFVNFSLLDDQIIENIRIWRNHKDIRKYMYNTEEIKQEEHLSFVKSLSTRNDKSYWLVYINDAPLGVINLINIDYNLKRAETGYYILPHLLTQFNGLEFLFSSYYFFFNILDLNEIYGKTSIKNLNALVINKLLGCDHSINTINYNGENYIEFIGKKENFQEAYKQKDNILLLAKLGNKYKKMFKDYIKNNNYGN